MNTSADLRNAQQEFSYPGPGMGFPTVDLSHDLVIEDLDDLGAMAFAATCVSSIADYARHTSSALVAC